MAYTTPPAYATGQVITATDWETYIRNNFEYVTKTFHGVLVRCTTTPATAPTAVPWDTETYDTDAFHSGGANTRLTVPAGLGGYYMVYAQVRWTSDAAAVRNIIIRQDGATTVAEDAIDVAGGGYSEGISPIVLNLAAGAYLEVVADSGGATTLAGGVAGANYFGMYLLKLA